MEAGRELDALVAKALGWIVTDNIMRDPSALDGPLYAIPCYSTEIRDAWLIVEKLQADYGVEIMSFKGKTICSIMEFHSGRKAGFAEADTATHAICLAALKAVT